MDYKTHIIGISGGTCSGKTYLSKSLQKFYGKEKLTIINLDSYYHDLSHIKFVEGETIEQVKIGALLGRLTIEILGSNS